MVKTINRSNFIPAPNTAEDCSLDAIVMCFLYMKLFHLLGYTK